VSARTDTAARLFELIGARKFEEAKALLTPDFVQEWPQSGERIRGPDNAMAVNENYPGLPTFALRRIVEGGDLVVAETTLSYGGTIVNGVHVFEFQGDRVARETDYFSEPFHAPDWRARWVERME